MAQNQDSRESSAGGPYSTTRDDAMEDSSTRERQGFNFGEDPSDIRVVRAGARRNVLGLTRTESFLVALCILLFIVLIIVGAQTQESVQEITARCALGGGSIGSIPAVSGVLTISQSGNGVRVSGDVVGLAPSSVHGMHIHVLGDLQKGCMSLGGHYNPGGVRHGAPDAAEHHEGDLGNIRANSTGGVAVSQYFDFVTLEGARTVLGRSIVVHAGQDDLGLANTADSSATGSAGARAACCVIGRTTA
ncbi:superoxide dismutase [Baffinella frigidus]|nr:superoxide dismutase [Cryptophyta sp. CCMP2293]